MQDKYDVLGLGNAIMDIIAPVTDSVLDDLNIAKGGMTLIDQDRALSLSQAFDDGDEAPREIAGGSGANTLVGIANLGANAAFIGKVADDELGSRFQTGMQDAGVNFVTEPLKGGEATARCLIAVTPDGERSMSTFLGASVEFSKEDLVDSLIQQSKVIYLEGYLFDKDRAKEAFVKAAEIARKANRQVALTLSDAFCVERHRESFKHLVAHHVDIVFANESELLSLYETSDFDAALQELAKHDCVGCVTRSEKGSVILADGKTFVIEAEPVDAVVDTTGAGDQYAAGVLGGRALGLSWAEAGKLGSKCAAEVIGHYGARPETKIAL